MYGRKGHNELKIGNITGPVVNQACITGVVCAKLASQDIENGVAKSTLVITTDRFSVYDQHVGQVPYKGQVLNQLTNWWFEHTADIVPNHGDRGGLDARDR